jgi:glycosyltransferase involved in cell wall biosynthesis
MAVKPEAEPEVRAIEVEGERRSGLVSTIIPVFNRPVLLIDAVQSVLSQTYDEIEVVLIDDGSTDRETRETISGLERTYPGVIVGIHRPNGGPGAARETGRQFARGEFIQYLYSDDLLLPGKFEVQVAALRDHPDCDIAYGKTHHSGVGVALEPVAFKRTGERFDTLFPALLLSRWWSTSTPLYRRALTDRIGPWLSLWNEEDWEYEARAGMLGARLIYCDHFVSVTRWHDDRLHHHGETDRAKLADRSQAHRLIYQHALDGGVRPDCAEMRHFARDLFRLSRVCGAAGLGEESKQLYNAAVRASGATRGRGLDFRLYRFAASLLGWEGAGRLARWTERFRSR